MTSQPIDHPYAADVGFTRRDLDLAARTAIIQFLEQRDQFHLDERQAQDAALEWVRDDLDDIGALNGQGDLPASHYGYSRGDVEQAAHDALGLFLELRYQHGYDEDHAQAAALSEITEGTDQRDDQKHHGDPRDEEVASPQSTTRNVATLHHTPEGPGTRELPTWLTEPNARRTGRRGPGEPSNPATRHAERVVDAVDDAACRAAMDAVGCDDDRWVDHPLGQQVYEDTLAERLREAGMTPEDHDRTIRERVARTERRQRIRGRYLEQMYGPAIDGPWRNSLAPAWVDVLVDRAMSVPSDPTDRELRHQIKHLEWVESVVGTTMASHRAAEQRDDLHILGDAWAVYDEGERRSAEQAYHDGRTPTTPRGRVLVAQAETRERLEAAERIEAGEDPATVYTDYTFPRNDELGPVTDMEAHPEPRTYTDTAREKLAELANYTEQVPDHDDTRQRLIWEAWQAMQQVPESERAQMCPHTVGDDSLSTLTVADPELDRLSHARVAGANPLAGEQSPFGSRERRGGQLVEVYKYADGEVGFYPENFAAGAAGRADASGAMRADRDVGQQRHPRDDVPAGTVLLHEVDEDPETGEEIVWPGEPIEAVDHDDAIRAMNRIIAGEDPEQVLRDTPHHPLIWGTDDEPAISPVPVTPDRSEQARERADREAAAREQLQAARDAADRRIAEPRDPDRDRHVDDRPPETTSHEIEHQL